MKITMAKNSKECCFKDIKIGDMLKFGNDFYLKLSQDGFTADDDFERYNAIAIKDWGCIYLEQDDMVIPVESELIIKE
jgi:hypothetical protein